MLEVLSNSLNPDDLTNSLVTIRASMAPVRKVIQLQNSMVMSKEQMNAFIESNPIYAFKKPNDLQSTAFYTSVKAFGSGASKALRYTSPSLYFARYCASLTANAFTISGETPRTYESCLLDLITREP